MKPAKQIMIDKIVEAIKNFGEETRNDKDTSLKDKCIQVDVLLDTIKFLDNYDENIKVLNDYYTKKDKWR